MDALVCGTPSRTWCLQEFFHTQLNNFRYILRIPVFGHDAVDRIAATFFHVSLCSKHQWCSIFQISSAALMHMSEIDRSASLPICEYYCTCISSESAVLHTFQSVLCFHMFDSCVSACVYWRDSKFCRVQLFVYIM